MNPYFKIVVSAWFFGWGLLFLMAPVPVYRFLSLGRTPSDKQMKYEERLGIMAVALGLVFFVELIFRVVR